MKWVFDKLKQAREALNLNQTQAASESGVAQKDISLLENGKKEFIPTPYIQFLYKKGVDLNSLFDEKLETVVIRPGEDSFADTIAVHTDEKGEKRVLLFQFKIPQNIAPNPASNIAPNFTEVDVISTEAFERWIAEKVDSQIKNLSETVHDLQRRIDKEK